MKCVLVLALLGGAAGGCERGCGSVGERGIGAVSPGATNVLPRPVVDCPDGLARCEEGTVSVSRLATVPVPCRGAPGTCTCPWEALAACPAGCAADGVEVVVDRARARTQLCAPGPDAGVFASPSAASSPPSDAGEACDEGDRYLCAGGRIIECALRAVVGQCLRGCFTEGASIGDDGVSREAAFAIMCSR
jgi:hypothetical protein